MEGVEMSTILGRENAEVLLCRGQSVCGTHRGGSKGEKTEPSGQFKDSEQLETTWGAEWVH